MITLSELLGGAGYDINVKGALKRGFEDALGVEAGCVGGGGDRTGTAFE